MEVKLSDIAPTILALMDEKKPKEMTGKNLIEIDLKKIQNTLLIILFSISSLNILLLEKTDDAKSNLSKIQKQINLIDKKIKENSKVKKGLNRSLKKHEKEISATKKEIFKVKKKQKSNKKKLANLNKKLKKLEKELFERRQLQNEILYQSYIKPKPGYLQLFIEGDKS